MKKFQDSYSLCRIFKKTIQIPTKTNEEEQVKDTEKEMTVFEEQVQGEDSSGGTEISREIMQTMDEKILNHDEHPKFLCDASSSDVTQGTCTPTDTCNNIPTEDFHAQFAYEEENSSAISYPMGISYPSNLFQVTFFILLLNKIIIKII